MKIHIKIFNHLTTVELYEILKARAEVFVVEQNCVYQDLDEKDKKACHVWIEGDGHIKAYLRVLERGVTFEEVSIGRVLTTERGKGYGNEILKAGIDVAKDRFQAEAIRIEAQCYAKGYYEKHGFRQCSEEFLEDGIPHIQMLWETSDT